MSFMIKQQYVKPHRCHLPPPQTENNRLVPGDVWKCDDCGQNRVWSLRYGSESWSLISQRQADKRVKRHLKGRSPKRRSGLDSVGPG